MKCINKKIHNYEISLPIGNELVCLIFNNIDSHVEAVTSQLTDFVSNQLGAILELEYTEEEIDDFVTQDLLQYVNEDFQCES